MNSKLFRDRIIWISGASSGIGKALSLRLAREGARVAMTARRAEVLEEIRAGQPTEMAERLLPLPADVLDPDALEKAYRQLTDTWGLPDMVIANAGTHIHMEPKDINAADCRKIIDVNLEGAVNLLTLVVPDFMAREQGHLIGVASLSGYRGLPNAAAYGASKAGLINFLQGLRFDLQPHGIAVTVINPGFVKTPLTDRNPFPMPFLIEVDQAIDAILDGLQKEKKEIHFPWQVSWILKTLRVLPYPLYHRLVRRITQKDRQ